MVGYRYNKVYKNESETQRPKELLIKSLLVLIFLKKKTLKNSRLFTDVFPYTF